MIENPIAVVIGGKTWLCPPMPFYCLERAWPHIQTMGRMGAANQALSGAQAMMQAMQSSGAEPATLAEQMRVVEAAERLVVSIGGDFIGQTHEALGIIVAALALQSPPPSFEELSRQLRPGEIAGLHAACTELMNASGLIGANPLLGEVRATSQLTPGLSNGHDSSPSLSPTA